MEQAVYERALSNAFNSRKGVRAFESLENLFGDEYADETLDECGESLAQLYGMLHTALALEGYARAGSSKSPAQICEDISNETKGTGFSLDPMMANAGKLCFDISPALSYAAYLDTLTHIYGNKTAALFSLDAETGLRAATYKPYEYPWGVEYSTAGNTSPVFKAYAKANFFYFGEAPSESRWAEWASDTLFSLPLRGVHFRKTAQGAELTAAGNCSFLWVAAAGYGSRLRPYICERCGRVSLTTKRPGASNFPKACSSACKQAMYDSRKREERKAGKG